MILNCFFFSGMGELHIDIIKDRLLKEHNVEAYLGPIQVAYRETITDKSELKHNFERSLGNVCHRVSIHLSVEPRSKCPTFEGLKVAYDREARNNLSALRADHFEALTDGVAMSVNSGPLLGFPLTDIAVFVHNCIVEPGTSLLMISAAAAQCLRLLLETKGSVRLLEPIMSLEIVTDDRCLHQVLGDLSNRRSRILEVDARHDSRIIRVRTPLAELLGYATALRVITSGMATFSMEFHEYEHMTANEQQKAIQRVTGVVVDH